VENPFSGEELLKERKIYKFKKFIKFLMKRPLQTQLEIH
jgi:hypothetical protein